MITSKKSQSPQVLLEKSLKKASELYGLRFDNRIDDLLGTGLKEKTLTYLYGEGISGVINILALNSVRHFGGRALFVDAGNTADPYLIRQKADLKKKDFAETRRLLKSIDLTRVFTCHQLTNFVIEQLPVLLRRNAFSDNPIRFVGVAGFDSVFSEEDSSKREIANLQHLIARVLHSTAKDKGNGVHFVVATSKQQSINFLADSDIVVEVYQQRKSAKERAALIRHPVMRGKEIEL